ncbi:MAG: putative rane protein [Bacteroidetes bacterium]|jgi:type IX secretion system PorP/SprF family membrane protein|nr:putative rane protein [Bacteroidota bacterium]MDF2450888.1 putative rane protein [Bacteroidota bacterium]
MKTKIILPIIVALIISAKSKAQDFHLTQYDAFSLYLNPALTGEYLGDEWSYKIHTVYRSQWKTLPVKPYQTYGLGFDKPYKRVGIGGYLLDNRSGGLDFNTLNFQLSGAYYITDPETSPHTLNVGVQAGLFYKTFNYNKVLFENQYDNETGQLNGAMSNGESFNKTSRVNFDANVGVFYKYKDRRSALNPFLGFSVFHVNMPMESFAGNDRRLPMRFNLNAGTDIRINDTWKVVPMALYMNQAQASELNVGALAYYRFNKQDECDVILGLNYRVKDAAMAQLGLKYNNYILRMSYDMTTSYLSTYTQRRGGYEITLQICGKKPKHKTGSYF